MGERVDKVTWRSLPQKDQLFVLTLARFCEPALRTSLSAYIYYQLKSIDSSLSSGEIIQQAATLQAVFTLSQCITALFWGRLSDSSRGGRKLVLMIGLAGSALSCAAFGFMQNFYQALLIRAIEGGSNGTAAVIRTMVSEVVEDQRYKARAFLLMPLCYNIAAIVSPVLASLVADPASTYPEVFGRVALLRRFPYAPPALLNATLVSVAFVLVTFRLKETLKPLRNKYDPGLDLIRKITRFCPGARRREQQSRVTYDELTQDTEEEMSPMMKDNEDQVERPLLPLRRMFTRNFCYTIACHAIVEGSLAAYNTLWPSLLSDPVASPKESNKSKLPFFFSGGLGMPVNGVATSLAILGVVGLPLQIFGYVPVAQSLGNLKLWRMSLCFLPLVFFIIPYVTLIPSKSPPPATKDGVAVWIGITTVQTFFMISCTFVIPSQLTMTNNASPHPSALGRAHSTGVMLSTFAQSVYPAVGGTIYGYGSIHGMTGLAWWIMSISVCGACLLSFLAFEGNGHEIWLENDE